ASSQSGARLMRSPNLVAKRIRHLESALHASIGSPGYGGQPAVGPECRRRARAHNIESRQQARREKVSDAALLLQPLPGRVSTYHAAQLQRETLLLVSGASVCAFEHGRTPGGSTSCNLRQQVVDIAAGLATPGVRSPLKKRAHA